MFDNKIDPKRQRSSPAAKTVQNRAYMKQGSELEDNRHTATHTSRWAGNLVLPDSMSSNNYLRETQSTHTPIVTDSMVIQLAKHTWNGNRWTSKGTSALGAPTPKATGDFVGQVFDDVTGEYSNELSDVNHRELKAAFDRFKEIEASVNKYQALQNVEDPDRKKIKLGLALCVAAGFNVWGSYIDSQNKGFSCVPYVLPHLWQFFRDLDSMIQVWEEGTTQIRYGMVPNIGAIVFNIGSGFSLLGAYSQDELSGSRFALSFFSSIFFLVAQGLGFVSNIIATEDLRNISQLPLKRKIYTQKKVFDTKSEYHNAARTLEFISGQSGVDSSVKSAVMESLHVILAGLASYYGIAKDNAGKNGAMGILVSTSVAQSIIALLSPVGDKPNSLSKDVVVATIGNVLGTFLMSLAGSELIAPASTNSSTLAPASNSTSTTTPPDSGAQDQLIGGLTAKQFVLFLFGIIAQLVPLVVKFVLMFQKSRKDKGDEKEGIDKKRNKKSKKPSRSYAVTVDPVLDMSEMSQVVSFQPQMSEKPLPHSNRRQERDEGPFVTIESQGRNPLSYSRTSYLEEIRAQSVLFQNNCLINAISNAAHGRNATEEELIEIRSYLSNAGQMMVASGQTIRVIRRALNIQHHIVVRYPIASQGRDERFAGVGHTLNIYHTGHQHFQHNKPEGVTYADL